MASSDNSRTRLRVAHLNPNRPTPFVLAPDQPARAALAAELGLIDLPALRFEGQVSPVHDDAWQVEGRLHARVAQPCVVSLQPVASELEDEVRLVFSPHVTPPEGEETEMPDDELEPLGQYIDLAAIMAEALALALPLYPRAADASLETTLPEDPATDDETRRPFAGLADLLAKRPGKP